MHLAHKALPFSIFVLLASPQMFTLTRSLGGNWIASADGLPKMGGLLLHGLVFVLLSHFLWKLLFGNKKSNCGCSA